MTEPTTPDANAQNPAPASQPAFNADDIINEIDKANKKIISDEVAQLIAKEKEEARKLAEKEFLINQKLKEKEQEIESLKQAQKDKELKAAQELEALKRKVDELASTKQPMNIVNPFATPPQGNNTQITHPVLGMKAEELDVVEKASLSALLGKKSER